MANEHRDYNFGKPPEPLTRRTTASNVTPIRGSAHPDPNVDCQTPNPMFVLGAVKLPQKFLGILVAVLLFAIMLGLLFHDWMVSGSRHPGEQKYNPGMQHKLP